MTTNIMRPIVVNDAPYQQPECCEECGRLRRENEALVQALRSPFLNVFLDGHNEHGWHVLELPGDTTGGAALDMIENTEDGDECHRIIKDASALGYNENHAVTTLWEFTDEFCEYIGISDILTRVFYGSPKEQTQESRRLQELGRSILDGES